MDEGVLKIVSALDDAPAAQAGLRRGDAIDRIDGVATRGLTLRDAVKRLRGEPQSTVALTVIRPGAVKPLELTIARANVRVDPVTSRLVAPGYAYVRINRFQDATVGRLAVELEATLRDSKGALRGVILDLRNNTGGLLNASVGVAAAFLPPDVPIAETKARSKTSAMRLLAQPSSYARRPKAPDVLAELPPVFKTLPMAVLVNGESASGAEIVAAALQDHKRATIIGSRTLGAGTLRTVFPMPEKTALNLTTARFVRPNGDAIEQKGVTPDIAIEGIRGPLPRIDAPDDPQVTRAVQVLESRRR
jgi:carboxyl-terminal processing protease